MSVARLGLPPAAPLVRVAGASASAEFHCRYPIRGQFVEFIVLLIIVERLQLVVLNRLLVLVPVDKVRRVGRLNCAIQMDRFAQFHEQSAQICPDCRRRRRRS